MALRAAAICALLMVVSAGCGTSSERKSSNSGDQGVCAQFGDVGRLGDEGAVVGAG